MDRNKLAKIEVWKEAGALNHLYFGRESKELLTTPEAAKALGCCQDKIRAMIDEGILEAHDTCVKRNALKPSWRVRRRSVALVLVETAQYEPLDFLNRVAVLLGSMNREQLVAIRAKADEILGEVR